jgi:hypothetical protein
MAKRQRQFQFSLPDVLTAAIFLIAAAYLSPWHPTPLSGAHMVASTLSFARTADLLAHPSYLSSQALEISAPAN